MFRGPWFLLSAVLLAFSATGTTVHAQRLFWAQRIGDRIVSAHVPSSTTATILQWPQVNDAVGLALDEAGGKIYWAQTIGDMIRRSNLDGTNVETVVGFPEVDGPVAIALDVAGGKIYWAQTFGDRIRRADLSGANVQTVVEWPLSDEVVSVALDIAGGKLYWAQSFGDRIARANLDGSGVQTILEWPQLNDPVGIALDSAGGKVYWAQTFGDRILRANLDGSGLETLLEWPELDDAVAIALDTAGGKLYWAQQLNDEVLSANLDGSNAQTLFAWPRLDDPVALVFDNSSVGPPGISPEPGGVSKSRFISFVPTGGGESAIRVTLTSLHHVNPPYAGGPSIPFSGFEGQVRWVGAPVQYMESRSSAALFYASSLQCTPHYRNWATVGVLHVSGSAIVPSSVYQVENLAASCAGAEETCTAVSAPLTLKTTRWADVETPYNPPEATSQPNISDVTAMVSKFRSALGAPIKARMLIAGNDANGNINIATISNDFNFSHIASCVNAFRGLPYPFKMGKCAVGPGVCTTDSDCTGASAPPCSLYCP